MDPETAFFTGIFLMLVMAVINTAEGMSTMSNPTERLYHFVNTPKTWNEAQNFCRANYVDLVTIDSMTTNMQVMMSTGDANVNRIWIGLEKKATEWWVWSEGIGEVTVFNWNVSKDYGDCVLMKPDGKWYANQCNELKASLCFEHDSQGKERYILNTDPLSWRDAQTYCRQHHTDLVSVKTTQQNDEIHVKGDGHTIWIGLVREQWTWSDRSAGSFRYWEDDNPNNVGGAENCVVMRKDFQYQWDDNACSRLFPFACYDYQKITRTVIKVRINSVVNLNLPAARDSLLKQFEARLEEQGVTQVKIHWLSIKKEQIFNRKQDEDSGTVKTCV